MNGSECSVCGAGRAQSDLKAWCEPCGNITASKFDPMKQVPTEKRVFGAVPLSDLSIDPGRSAENRDPRPGDWL